MANIYWSILILALGACIGSFLNVVIYRWPLGLSVRSPVRSFCPACGSRIAWYDNLPVLSYLLLRGRCRACGGRISLQYPLVEMATALVFLMTYDALFMARLRLGVTNVLDDWPILLGHWALFAGLIALTVMDLEAYVVDIRVTWVVSLAGLVCHTLWTPAGSHEWIRPGTVQAGWAIAAAAGLALGAVLLLRRQPAEPLEEDVVDDGSPPPGEPSATNIPPFAPPNRWFLLVLPVVLVAGYAAAMLLAEPSRGILRPTSFEENGFQFDAAGSLRAGLGLLLLFAALTGAASHPRAEADAQIVADIEFEAVDARRMALWELKLIAPAMILSAGVMAILLNQPTAREGFDRLLDWRVGRDWQPVWGMSTALAGWVIGGAVGWLARILFTLLFGKEALGMGDVHILAAAGAVAGWPVAFFGFFIGAMLALAGLVVIRLRRQARMLPYGPWLGLGFFLAAVFQDWLFEYLRIRWLFE